MSNGLQQRGLLKLMLKLPTVRGKLQVLSARGGPLEGLCEAYDEATEALQRFHSNLVDKDAEMIVEYEAICAEIEADIVKICVDSDVAMPK
jgi:hypothetical protein